MCFFFISDKKNRFLPSPKDTPWGYKFTILAHFLIELKYHFLSLFLGMRYISARTVIPLNGEPIENGMVSLEADGTVAGVYADGDEKTKTEEREFYDGVLIPGFVNAHCHLELSHMRGRIPRRTGLPGFLREVMKTRRQDENEIRKKMAEADAQMYANGIQAVGDHANTAHSAEVKANSPIIYRTFVEVMGLRPDQAPERIAKARETASRFAPKLVSITPHAPYSCSEELFSAIGKSIGEGSILSVHNQESEEENRFFREKKGDFLPFLEAMGMDLDRFRAQGKSSIEWYLPMLPSENRILLVHNTFTSPEDLDLVSRRGRNAYYCLCPKANLYIEDRLPKMLGFIPDESRMVVGTDSLASNDTLDMLSELKVLAKADERLDFLRILPWATINGARALALDHVVGSIETGKRPGLLLLEGMEGFRLTDEVRLRRLA